MADVNTSGRTHMAQQSTAHIPLRGKCPSCGRCLDCNPPVAPYTPSPWTWPNQWPQYPIISYT